MPIKSNIDLDAVFGNIYRAFDEQIIPAVIEQLELVCLEVVKEARMLPSPPVEMRGEKHQPNYIDDSGNLRASIGYVLYHNGQTVSQNFEGSSEGTNKGLKVANEVAGSWPTGIVAVIVSGEDYSLYVESRGYDVITGPCMKINGMLRDRLQDIMSVYK
jgi:hypothetical protein